MITIYVYNQQEMDLLKNSYVILTISFVTLCIVFYLGEWGYSVTVVDGRPIKRFSWKYPLAISLIIWVVWHFYVHPPADEIAFTMVENPASPSLAHSAPKPNMAPLYSPGSVQNINMVNWT